MHGVPAQPLSPEEIELLQIELVGHMDTAGNMPLDVAHGFLTATAAEEQLKPFLDPPNLVAHRETAGKLADAVVGLYRWRLAGSDS
jgi:predicted RNA-binding Zn ribbon-like protein